MSEEVPALLEETPATDIQEETPEIEEHTLPVLTVIEETAAVKVPIVKTPVIKSIMFVDNGEQYEAEVLSRGGKATGKYSKFFNVFVRETGQEVCLDVSKLDEFVVLSEDKGSSDKDFTHDLNASHVMYSAFKDPFAVAKQAEVAEDNVFSKVSISTIDARKVISCTWVKSDKDGEKRHGLWLEVIWKILLILLVNLVSISTIDARKVISCTWVKSDKDGEKRHGLWLEVIWKILLILLVNLPLVPRKDYAYYYVL